jgi:hypothetical protein
MRTRTAFIPLASVETHAQHDALRDMMDRCEELADELDAGRGNLVRLRRAVALLRAAFNGHRAFEDQAPSSARASDPSGSVRVVRVHENRDDERRAIRVQPEARPTEMLRDVIATLRSHLAGEERHLLHEAAIPRSRGDRIRRRTGHPRRGSRDVRPRE